MAGIVQLNGQFYGAVLWVAEEKVDVLGGNRVEGALPVGPVEAFLRGEHIRNADFREDEGLVAHGLCEHAVEGAFGLGQQVRFAAIAKSGRPATGPFLLGQDQHDANGNNQ